MKRILIPLLILFCYRNVNGQISVQSKIDTSNSSVLEKVNFIKSYFSSDTLSNTCWHPKYKNKVSFDYTIDWFFGKKSPKKLSKYYDLDLVELQQISDTLSYFKILAKSRPSVTGEEFYNVFKYYLVKKDSRFYLDNCKAYESERFTRSLFSNITFYTSPFYPIAKNKMADANKAIGKLYQQLQRPKLTKPIEYYMCSTEEEMNSLSNIVIWNGGLSAYTNIPEGFIVGINDNPEYNHEFVHAILGESSDCFFLQEGIAVLYGGMDKGNKTFKQGLQVLKKCFQDGDCNFDKLYKREIQQKYNSGLTYTFAAVFCKYIIDQYGLTYFYEMYYDKSIDSKNFLDKLSEKTGIKKELIQSEVEKMIVD